MIDRIIVANWRLDIAKSPAFMLQKKTAGTPYTLRFAGRCRTRVPLYARSHAVRAYISEVGYSFSSFDMLAVCTAVQHTAFSSLTWKEKAPHGTAAPQKQQK